MLITASVRLLPAFLFCVLLLTALTLPVCAATLYVSPNGSDNNSGAAASPYATIQAAVNNASTGDTVTLHTGTYSGNGNRDVDFGGKSLTVNSQSGAGRTIIDSQGDDHTAHHAFYFHTKENGVLLEGLTLANGSSAGSISMSAGGVINVMAGCTVKINKCVFSGDLNYGIYNSGNIVIENSTFTHNPGGSMSNAGQAILTHCIFTDNINAHFAARNVENEGTLIMSNCAIERNAIGVINYSKLALTNCIFIGNTGGGVSNGGSAELMNCNFIGNTSQSGSAGFSNGGFGSVVTLIGCNFAENISTRGPGAIDSGYQATLIDCTLTGNTAISCDGGAIGNPDGGQLIVRFCSISGNVANGKNRYGSVSQGGGLENDGTATLTDNVLWGNTAPYADEIGTPVNGHQTTTATYCDIQGGLSGTGNMKTNPGFIDAANGNLHLQAGSPCRGAGIAILPTKADPKQYASKPDPGVLTDADGKHRPNPPSIGAYEYSASAPPAKKVPILDTGSSVDPNAAPDAAAGGNAAAEDASSPVATVGMPSAPVPAAAPQPRPKLWPAEQQQENAAFLQLMVSLNTQHDSVSDMAEKIQAELDKGADINARDSEGFPVIVTAASLSHTDVVQVLLEHGADVNAVTEQAAKSSAADSASILHKTAAGGYQVDLGGAIAGLFAKKPKPLYGQSALMFASQSGQSDLVTLLLSHSADVQLKDSRGKNASDYASQNHQDAIVQALRAQAAKQ